MKLNLVVKNKSKNQIVTAFPRHVSASPNAIVSSSAGITKSFEQPVVPTTASYYST